MESEPLVDAHRQALWLRYVEGSLVNWGISEHPPAAGGESADDEGIEQSALLHSLALLSRTPGRVTAHLVKR